MDPATLLFAGQLMNFAVTYGIPAARKIIAAVYTPEPKQSDWEAAFDTATIHTDKFLERTKNLVPTDVSNG